MKKNLVAVLFLATVSFPVASFAQTNTHPTTESLQDQIKQLTIQFLLAEIASLQKQINDLIAKQNSEITITPSLPTGISSSHSDVQDPNILPQNQFKVEVSESDPTNTILIPINGAHFDLGKNGQIHIINPFSAGHEGNVIVTDYPQGFTALQKNNNGLTSVVSNAMTLHDVSRISFVANTPGTWRVVMHIPTLNLSQTLTFTVQ